MLFAFSTDLYSICYLILDRMEKGRRFLDRKLFAKIRVKLVNNGGEFLSDFLLVLNY